MKNVVKKLFSLLLVGVVAISMFSFVAPPAEATEAAEAGSNGTLIINQSGIYYAGFHVTFYSFSRENLGEYDTGYLAKKNTREFKVPKNTYNVHVYVAISAGKKRHFDFYADESVVNEKSRIELTSTKTSLHPKFDVKFNNGWSEKKPEYSHEESIQFKSYFNADNPNMYFKATFYGYDCQIGEKSVKLSNIGNYPYGTVVDSETIKIPKGTTSIKVEVIKEGTPIDSATLEYIPKSDSKDDITITLGDTWNGSWDPMKINCPNSWKYPEPPKPAEANSYGTLSIRNKAWYTAGFHVTFYSLLEENLGEYDTGYLEGWGFRHSRDFEIPKNTYRVRVDMAIKGSEEEKTIDFHVEELAVNENSRIELTSDGALGSSRFKVKTNNGWSEKKPESSYRGVLKFNSFANPWFGGLFKVTFYKDDQKLGEESLNLFTGPHETIKIPDYTNRIEATIIDTGRGWWETRDSATLKLAGKASSTDVITINFGYKHSGLWSDMEFNYPECWQRI